MKNKEFNALNEQDLSLVSGGAVVEVSVIQGWSYKVVKIDSAKWYQKGWAVQCSNGKIVSRCWTENGAENDAMELRRENFLHQDERYEKYNEMVRRNIIT